MKNKHKILIIGAILGYTIIAPFFSAISTPSDAWIRSRVVKLQGNGASCTGEQVKAPSGETYILSAAHCKVTQVGDSIEVVTEDGKTLNRRVIAEDANSDLLLIEGLPSTKGLDIAPNESRFQHVRTFTRGLGLPTYKTYGFMVGTSHIKVLMRKIENGEDESACKAQPKNEVEGDGEVKACIMSIDEAITTAKIVPGSSGGPIVDDSGELLGVASATDGYFGYIVTLSDIKAFLKNY